VTERTTREVCSLRPEDLDEPVDLDHIRRTVLEEGVTTATAS
jgi:hypothetical protein